MKTQNNFQRIILTISRFLGMKFLSPVNFGMNITRRRTLRPRVGNLCRT